MEDLELKGLDQFYGTTKYTTILGVNVTDGIEYIMSNGYRWFVMDFLTAVRNYNCLKEEQMLCITLTVDKEQKGLMTVTTNEAEVLYKAEYEYASAKVDKLELFFTENILMLPGEF